MKKTLTTLAITTLILFSISFISAGGDCWDNGNPISLVTTFGQSVSCSEISDGPTAFAMKLGANWKGGCSKYLISDYEFHPERYETRGFDDDDAGCFCKYGYAVFPHTWENDTDIYWYKGKEHYCEPIKFDEDKDGFYVPHEDYIKPIAWPYGWSGVSFDWSDRYYIPEPYDNNDTDPEICPTCPELCDKKDNNGNGIIDEGCPVDNDKDGVYNNTDCDDNDPTVWQILPGYSDMDNDGFGYALLLDVCSGNTLPSGFVNINSDCNDNNPLINPNAPEICNGQDDNCDGITDEGCPIIDTDKDKDGYDTSADCNDNNPLINPGMNENCSTPYDDNCDGLTNEGCQTTITCSLNSDCGNPFVTSSNYCWLTHVYQDITTPTCNNANTIGSYCSNESSTNLITLCTFGCDNGGCLDTPIQCTIDADCGNESYSTNYCSGDDVYRNQTTPGCENGTCSFNETSELVKNCGSGYDCDNGKCEKEDDDDDNKDGKRSSNGLCGDLICDALNGENKITCPEDCDESFPQNLVQQLEPIILQNISEFTSNENNPSTTWWIISIILIILVIIIITFIIRIL